MNATTVDPLISNVSAEMWMRVGVADVWVPGVTDETGRGFIWGLNTENEEFYDLCEDNESTLIRYIDLENFTRMPQWADLVAVANSVADQRKATCKGYTSKPLVSVNEHEIQGEHGEPDEVHRNMLLYLRYQNGLVASNSSVAAEQLSAMAMMGFATGVYAGPKIETEGDRSTIRGTHDTPFVFATDGHIAGGQPNEGAFGQ